MKYFNLLPSLIVVSSLVITLSAGCSVYKSEGRKKFETDTPQRVPITHELSCFPNNPLETNVVSEEISLIKPTSTDHNSLYKNSEEANPIRTILVTQDNDHLTLVIKNSDSQDYCLTLPISKSEYLQNKQQIITEINSWP